MNNPFYFFDSKFSWVFLFLLLLFPLISICDSTNVNIWKKPKFFLQLDRFNSFVEKRGADVSGIKAGIEFGKKYRIGLGYYNLKSDIIEIKRLTPEQAADAPADTVKARLRMSYYPVCVEYIFYDKGKWQFGIPVNLGYGRTYFEYYDSDDKLRRIRDHGVLLTDVVLSGQYKILKWVGVGAGIGFRKILIDNPSVERNFDSPLYNIRLKIFIGEVYKSVFPNGLSGKK